MNDVDWQNTDAICCVLSNYRSSENVRKFLAHFLYERDHLAPDYHCHPENEEILFESEQDMISCFADTPSYSGLFFWNGQSKILDGKVMLGADFMPDGKTIYSITSQANGKVEEEILDKLKGYLGSDAALIYYNQYPGFENSLEF
ncbi:hypothetical protein [Teredinibacter haidensis]|uniref:hypothetical protein n=1 Tax=Teredinibacter haidensis TaxID=2731755 RepID=UPI000948E72D|nr:hypothetical protein [Teredinibacter haidensis]